MDIPRHVVVGVPRHECEAWGESCDGVDLGDRVGEWLSDIIIQDSQ